MLFALFMSLWGIMFLEFWKRRKNELSYEWDLFDYEQGTQVIRPQFERKARLAVLKNEKKKNSWWQTNPVTLVSFSLSSDSILSQVIVFWWDFPFSVLESPAIFLNLNHNFIILRFNMKLQHEIIKITFETLDCSAVRVPYIRYFLS